MSSDEREILQYLQTWDGVFVNAKEVCRRASTKKRFHEDPDWARPLLLAMVDNGLLEKDLNGRFRVKPERKKGHNQKWISPDIEKILNDGGVNIDEETGDSVADE